MNFDKDTLPKAMDYVKSSQIKEAWRIGRNLVIMFGPLIVFLMLCKKFLDFLF